MDYQDYESEAQEYADMVADNQIATWAEFDNEMLLTELPTLDLDVEMLGMIEIPKIEEEKPEKDISDELKEAYQVVVECEDEEQQERVFEQLNEMGLKCRVLTL